METTVVKMLYGSHVYGTNNEDSDTDFKGVALPPARDIILQRSFKTISKSTGNDVSKNTKEDVDDDCYALHYYLKQLLDGQTYALDMLYTPKQFYELSSPIWEMILENRTQFLHKGIASFAGYCQAQAAKYSLKGSNLAAFRLVTDFFAAQPPHLRVGHVMDKFQTQVLAVADSEKIYHDKTESIIRVVTIPHKNTKIDEYYIQVGHKTKVPFSATCQVASKIYAAQVEKYGERAKLAETNQGVDFKALSHAVRVCREAEELLLTGHITFPLTDPMIKKIKQKEIPFAQVSELIIEGLDRVYAATEKSSLPAKPNFKFAEDLIVNVYGKVIALEFGPDMVSTGVNS